MCALRLPEELYSMSNELLSYVEINPSQPAKASVIWLHGLGADGYDFANIVPELKLPADLAIRFVFPHAPVRPVTINAGTPMRAWYDILGFDFNSREDAEGVHTSQQAINDLIAQEKKSGISAGNIVLAGFSQGGAMALHCGLRYPERLAGIIALSCYLPLARNFHSDATTANKKTPIFMAHGDQDPILPLQIGEASAELLTQAGHPVEFHSYVMPHSVCVDEIAAISSFLQKILQ